MKASFLLLLVPFLSSALALPLQSPSSGSVNGASTLVDRTTAGTTALYRSEKRGGSARSSTNPPAESKIEPRNDLDHMPYAESGPEDSDTSTQPTPGSGAGSHSGSDGSTISLTSVDNTVLTIKKVSKKFSSLEIKWAKIYKEEGITKFIEDVNKQRFTLTKKKSSAGQETVQATAEKISFTKAMDLVRIFKTRYSRTPNYLIF